MLSLSLSQTPSRSLARSLARTRAYLQHTPTHIHLGFIALIFQALCRPAACLFGVGCKAKAREFGALCPVEAHLYEIVCVDLYSDRNPLPLDNGKSREFGLSFHEGRIMIVIGNAAKCTTNRDETSSHVT